MVEARQVERMLQPQARERFVVRLLLDQQHDGAEMGGELRRQRRQRRARVPLDRVRTGSASHIRLPVHVRRHTDAPRRTASMIEPR